MRTAPKKTTTPNGKLVLHVFGAVAEFERDLIFERRMAGLEAAKVRGRKGGRKPAMDEKKIALASKLMRDRETPISEVCEAVGVSRVMLYCHLEPDGKWRCCERRGEDVTESGRDASLDEKNTRLAEPIRAARGTGVRSRNPRI